MFFERNVFDNSAELNKHINNFLNDIKANNIKIAKEYEYYSEKLEEEEELKINFRKGFCGEVCDCVIAWFKSKYTVNVDYFMKKENLGEHFIIRVKNGLIIDPTYKQAFVKFVDGSPKLITDNKFEIEKYINLPDIYYGDINQQNIIVANNLYPPKYVRGELDKDPNSASYMEWI